MKRFLLSSSILLLSSLLSPAHAGNGEELRGRGEVNWRLGSERSILMSEIWAPFWQGHDGVGADRVLYGDVRLMGDDRDNREFNLGVGYRQYMNSLGSVLGGALWFDRRLTELDSAFHQVAIGGEVLGDSWDLRVNAYVPLSDEKSHLLGGASPSGAYLAGTGIYYNTGGQSFLIEEPQKGIDLEIGWKVPFTDSITDSTRVYAGAYHFAGDKSEDVTGWRARIASDITSNFQVGARFQKDDERGSQGFLEATVRFPFGQKKSYREDGVRSRLDESPERDIDIVTGTKANITPNTQAVAVNNASTGTAQRVIYLDSAAAAGGTGSLDSPYNTAVDAIGDLQDNDILYIKTGAGAVDGGMAISHNNVQVIGEGTSFVFDNGRLSAGTSTGQLSGSLIRAASVAPTITNTALGGDGVTVSGNDVLLTGFTVDGAQRYGIYALGNGGNALTGLAIRNVGVTNNVEDGVRIEADGAGSSAAASLQSVTATGNKNGVRFYAHNDASVTGSLQSSAITSNSQHGVIVYDDSAAGSVDADLGGGGRSTGLNALTGNTLEDLALDIDGANLFAQNNWWGQASGLYQSAPSGGLKPQIYYGAPINDGLVMHLTLDNEWVSGNTAYDRSGNDNNGTMAGGLNSTNLVNDQMRQGLQFDGDNDEIVIANSAELNSQAFTVLAYYTLPYNLDTGVNNNWRSFLRKGGTANTVIGWDITIEEWHGMYFDLGDGSNTQRTPPLFSSDTGISVGNPVLMSFSYDDSTKVREVIAGNGGTATVVNNSNLAGFSYDPGSSTVGISDGINTGLVPNEHGYTPGIFDDVRIYGRALTSQEVEELYRMNAGSSVDTSSYRTSAP